MMAGLSEQQWDRLVRAVNASQCTPFIGAGASAGAFPTGGDLARRWAEDCRYPLVDSDNLQRVSQYLAITEYGLHPKALVEEEFAGAHPELSATPYPRLAKLPFKVYVTTNFDNLIERSLAVDKAPEYDLCRWNRFDEVFWRPSFEAQYEPSPARPLVYHLHGRYDVPQSIVLTEEDYLDFLVALAESGERKTDVLDPRVIRALAGDLLVFLGYSLSDSTFRVIMRGLMGSIKANIRGFGVAIQLDPADVKEDRLEEARNYLTDYFAAVSQVKIGMYWGEADAFVAELAERCGVTESV